MTPIIAFGEALVDMLSSHLGDQRGDQPETLPPEVFTPYAGGAPANVAVACARLGVPSRFLGMLGNDHFGDFLARELAAHGVDISGMVRTREARTALAFVSRDADGERTFDFYRPPAADLLYRQEHLPAGVFADPVILHLCTNSLTEPAIAETTLAMAEMARRAGCLVSVDANLRHNLWEGGAADISLVTQLLDGAELLKLSQDELDYLRADHPEDSWLNERLAAGVKAIVITSGPGAVRLLGVGTETRVTPPSVQAVDTTAGGDAFIGGLLAELAEHTAQVGLDGDWHRDRDFLARAVDTACRCGAHAVTLPGAYVSLPTRADLQALRG
ncbi:carbohydrate kinase family protein [Halomonas urumqiensis]|uniref:Carbohydrate kinase n=1 Tax=Halomonas urumqiensis TaxID=1684789 RepID=A0A2N7UHJ4_9GAMM|nr:carbohydrate kinase [Halomonas urumqiensis]PMR79892.1 carbohydrate kinase [Halomonas urumqiensis]PTB02083.1 carbohydrate kinase [Halomonas urumqiensis]GHE21526.1 fructokinase [Halomonas urumqiensis]